MQRTRVYYTNAGANPRIAKLTKAASAEVRLSVMVQEKGERLFGFVPEVGDEVISVLGLLQAAKSHLGAGNILFRVFEILKLLSISIQIML